MKPLRIDWEFYTPVVTASDFPHYLDAILAFAVFQEALELEADDPIAASDDLSHIFESQDYDGQSVWKASALHFYAASEQYVATMSRRVDHSRFQIDLDRGVIHGKRKKIDSARGPDRNYFMFHNYQWINRASAWCIADPETLSEMLGQIKAIGKMTRNGWGRISSMQIVEDEQAHEKWKIRALPLQADGAPGVQYFTSQTCLSAPYWDRKRYVMGKAPVLTPT